MNHCLISAPLLISLLAANSNDPTLVILDCRHDLMNPQAGPAAFAAGHIPGAQFASIDSDLAGTKTGADGEFKGRHPLPEIDVFIATLRRWGISEETQVVAYDAHGGMYAARLWWMLRWVGHANVQVLDGDFSAWKAAGGAVSVELSPRPLGTIQIRPSLSKTVTVAELVTNLAHPQMQVLDARSPDRFRGENEVIDPVGGHIPGAKNRFFKDNLQANGQFKSSSQLRSEFEALLASSNSSAEHSVMQCGSGVTACHNLLALAVAEMPGAALYPGSWSQWCADTARPVATGPD
jgi:thiosulfate/3-mercaptopyruvate sulfurtransferase